MRRRVSRIHEFYIDHATYFAAALVTFYVIAGVFYSQILSQELRFPDERLYVKIANNVSSLNLFSSNGEVPTAERAPAYAFLLSLFVRFENGLIYARIMNFIFVGVSAFLCFKILCDFRHALAGILSIFLLLFYPLVFFTAGTLYPQSLATFLLVAISYLLLSGRYHTGYIVGTGLVYGILLLVLPAFLAFLPVFGFMVYRSASGGRRGPLPALSVFLIASALVLAPWLYRNYDAFGQFVFVSTNSGLMLLLGNSENTRVNIGPRVDIARYRNIAEINSANPAQYDGLLRKQAIQWIANNPNRAFFLYLKKFINWFNFSNKLATESEESVVRDIILFMTYYTILLLAVWNILFDKFAQVRSLKIYIALLYLGAGAIYAVFFTRIRYRVPFDAMMMMLAALQVEALVKRYLLEPKEMTARG